MKNKIWALVIGALVVVVACFGFYYLGQKSQTKQPGYNPVIDNNKEYINVDPGFEEELEKSTYLALKPVSTKYGIGDYELIGGKGDLTSISGLMNYSQFNDYTSNAFINVERQAYANSKNCFYSLRFSTQIGKFVVNELSQTYDANIVFGFETIDGNLKLRFSFVSYGEGTKKIFNFQGNPQFGKHSIVCPTILTKNYQDVCLLLGEEGFTIGDATWKMINSDKVIYLKHSVLSSMKTLVASIVNKYADAESTIHCNKGLNISSLFSVKDDVEYDFIVSDFWYQNIVEAVDDESFETIEYFLNDLWGTKETDYYIPYVNVEF